jgi:ParB/RepB/Spo0J family partition protein
MAKFLDALSAAGDADLEAIEAARPPATPAADVKLGQIPEFPKPVVQKLADESIHWLRDLENVAKHDFAGNVYKAIRGHDVAEPLAKKAHRAILAYRSGANGHAAARLAPDVSLEGIPAMPKDALLALGRAAILTLGDLRKHAAGGGWRTLETALGTVRGMTMKWANTAAAAIRDAGGDLGDVQPLAYRPEERAPVPPVDDPRVNSNGPSQPEPDELVFVSLASIAPHPRNPRRRFDQAELEQLAASIRSKGIIEPVILRPHPGAGCKSGNAYQLVAGERRVRAAALAGLQRVPAIVRRLNDQDCLEVMVVENDQRAETSPLEKAEGYAALLEFPGMTVAKIAAKVGQPTGTIQDLLKLRQLPEVAKKAVDAGVLPTSTAILIARIPGEGLRTKAAHHILSGACWWEWTPKPRPDDEPLNYRAARELIHKHCMVKLAEAGFDRKALDLVPGVPSCDACPKRVGNLQKQDPEGYKGARADVCTDPECYERKVEAWGQREAEVAKQQGFKVLPAKVGLELFDQHSNHISWRAREKYVDLDRTCHEDKRQRTYGQLLGDRCKGETVVAFDHAGRVRRLVEIAAAKKVLREAHNIGVPGGARLAQTTYDVERRQAEAAQRRKHEAGKAAALKANGIIAEEVERIFDIIGAGMPKTAGDRLQALVVSMVSDARLEQLSPVNKRRGLPVDRDALAKFIKANKPTAPQLLGILAEVIAAGLSHNWGHPYFGDRVDPLFPAFGIDKAALMKEAAAAKKKQPPRHKDTKTKS